MATTSKHNFLVDEVQRGRSTSASLNGGTQTHTHMHRVRVHVPGKLGESRRRDPEPRSPVRNPSRLCRISAPPTASPGKLWLLWPVIIRSSLTWQRLRPSAKPLTHSSAVVSAHFFQSQLKANKWPQSSKLFWVHILECFFFKYIYTKNKMK